MSDQMREAMKYGFCMGVGMGLGTAVYDLLTGSLGVETAYRATFIGILCTVAFWVYFWVFPIKKSSS
jgi:hypothetical protein